MLFFYIYRFLYTEIIKTTSEIKKALKIFNKTDLYYLAQKK